MMLNAISEFESDYSIWVLLKNRMTYAINTDPEQTLQDAESCQHLHYLLKECSIKTIKVLNTPNYPKIGYELAQLIRNGNSIRLNYM